MGGGSAYRRAGVDLDASASAVALIRDIALGAARPEVVEGVGGFAGLFRMNDGRLLAAAADGVGTKVEVARRAGRLDTVGIDLVAMCANDVVTTGAEPLFFLDYIATASLVPEQVAALVSGVAEGCRRAGCALLGGETAEHPGHLQEGRFDLAGFCVGLVEERARLAPHLVREGDVLIGLPSSGVHSNGFSLIRRVLDDAYPELAVRPEGLSRPLAEELLEPTAIYARAVVAAARRGLVRSAAHITGGGMVENVGRALPEGIGADIETGAWRVPGVFRFIAELADASEEEMYRTFNMGIGMVLVTSPDAEDEAVSVLEREGVDAIRVGRVTAAAGVRFR